MKYLVVIEKAKRGFSAYLPDLPGCVATAPTRQGVERVMRKIITFHLEVILAVLMKLPAPRSSSTYLDFRS